AGDIIGFVADKRLVIYDLLGGHTEFFDHIFIFNIVLVIAREIYDRALVYELQQIAVAGDDLDTESLFGGDARDGTQNIVSLEAFHFKAWNIEGIHHFPYALDLRT